MALPPLDPLWENLCALRDAEDPTDRRHDAHWREVIRWIEQAFPGRSRELEDARQETFISLMRHVSEMRAATPLQAAKWIATILRSKRIDRARARGADPVFRALRAEKASDDRTPRLDRLVAPEADPDRRVLERLTALVLEHVHRALEEEPGLGASRRALRRTQAQAALLRLVCGADAGEIESVLSPGEPTTKDRIYKWVERGRPIVRLGLDRWERTLSDEEERAEAAPVIAVLREIMDERRADAGLPRPERRKESAEGP